MKTPLFPLRYEPSVANDYTEHGAANGARLDLATVPDDEVRSVLSAIGSMSLHDTLAWLKQHAAELGPDIMVTDLEDRSEADLARLAQGRQYKLIVIARPVHTIKDLDECLALCSRHAAPNCYLYCNSMTAMLKKQLIKSQWPWGVAHVLAAGHYLWHRVAPKLRATQKLYYAITDGKNRTFNRVEIMGRVSKAGFRVVDEQFRGGHYFVVGQKECEPITGSEPSVSPIVALKRVGKGGKEVVIYKFRTMYSYSEYLQPYIYEHQHLKTGGKINDDYRINMWGRLLRPVWLDELPMLYNILHGDIKLVGVRPLSRHYFNLYSPEMQELRTQVKPGLLPPFYYEARSPETLDDIQASERRYLEAYLKAPYRTDWRYFWGIVWNILFKRKHSA